jgi:hypothetical protein
MYRVELKEYKIALKRRRQKLKRLLLIQRQKRHWVLRILLNKLYLIETCGEVGRKRRLKRHNYKVWKTFENCAVDFDRLGENFVFE